MPERLHKATLRLDLSGPDGNVYVVVAAARQVLKALDRGDPGIGELADRLPTCRSYDEALAMVREYVNLVDVSREAEDIA
jgi:hypothetical protein